MPRDAHRRSITTEVSEVLSRVARPVALVLGGMGVFMALCGVLGLLFELGGFTRPLDEGAAMPLLLSALVTVSCAGVGSQLARRAPEHRNLSRRDATLAVAMIWLGAGLFGGLPFILGAGLSIPDAMFEALSGFTTTGATILGDIEGTLSRPLLLWRSIIQWLGGMGIVVLFVAVFPNVGVGGKHMFKSEVPGPTAEGLQPRITQTSLTLWGLYTAFTVMQVIILACLGALIPPEEGVARMTLFEAVCHSLTTMSTGGFSTQNASIAAFNSSLIESVITVFMLIAGVNFGLYFGALRAGSLKGFLRSDEFKVYIGLVMVATCLLTLGILEAHGHNPVEAFRYASFMVATTITSTGFGTDDYMAYPAPALTIVLLLMFVGGMSGSTAGGIKVSRFVLLTRTTVTQIRKTMRPSVVQVVQMSGRAVPQPVLTEVAVFFFVYMSFLGMGTFAISGIEGVSVPTAFGAMLTSLSNMGPGPFYEGVDNFASYSDLSKVLFSAAMVLGRLEFFTLLALLLPDFWRR
ncbi:MAG: TrkH family potassium uptake protein [Myxococcota bacterium]